MSRYEDMLYLPHPAPSTRARMSDSDRAAQFAPFAALTGHDAAIQETARLTDGEIELDESRKEILNRKLQAILSVLHTHPEVTILWFCPDAKKSGGSYVETTGSVKKLDPYGHALLLADAPPIPIEQIYQIESPLFADTEF